MAEQCPVRLLGVWFDTVQGIKHRQRTGLVTQACESSTWEYEKEGFWEFKAGQSGRLGSRSAWARERSANKEKYRSGRLLSWQSACLANTKTCISATMGSDTWL